MIYLAGPMFSEAELAYNLKLAEAFEIRGARVFLPQRDGFVLSEMLKTMTFFEASRLIYEKDIENIRVCGAFVYNLDGRVPDEGAAVALGHALAFGKRCFGVKTDPRCATAMGNNPMIAGSLERVFSSADEAAEYLTEKEHIR